MPVKVFPSIGDKVRLPSAPGPPQVASIRSCTEVQQATAVLALGNMHPACHGLVLAESLVLADDYLDRQMARVRGCAVCCGRPG